MMDRFMLRFGHFIRATSVFVIVVARSAEPAYAAIGNTGESTNPKSPPFRYLSRRYRLSDLEETLAEGIIVGHKGLEMPQFQFSPVMIDALLAYMTSVQAK